MKSNVIGCLAFYDFDIAYFKIKEWINYVEEWMKLNGYPANTMGLPHSGKFLRYNNGKRKLEKEQYKIQNIDFYGGGEPGTDYAWKLAAYYGDDNKATYLCFNEELITFSYNALEKLLIDICQFCSPKYAIGFEREKKYGPDYYARGIAHGLKLAYEDAEHGREDDRIYCWQKAYHRKSGTYKTGDLRDVYRFNVLSQAHLDRFINGQRFEDWVQEIPLRGTLKKISDTLWTWWVEPELIPEVREALAPSGMILCL